jgi:hypothetical protein
MNKRTYYGYYSISGGQIYNREAYEYTNLTEGRKSIRSIATGNCPKGNRGSWWINDINGDEIARGRIRR